MERLRRDLFSDAPDLERRDGVHYWVMTGTCRAWCFHCGAVYLWNAGVRRYIPLRPTFHVRLADGSPILSEELHEPRCVRDPEAWRVVRIDA